MSHFGIFARNVKQNQFDYFLGKVCEKCWRTYFAIHQRSFSDVLIFFRKLLFCGFINRNFLSVSKIYKLLIYVQIFFSHFQHELRKYFWQFLFDLFLFFIYTSRAWSFQKLCFSEQIMFTRFFCERLSIVWFLFLIQKESINSFFGKPYVLIISPTINNLLFGSVFLVTVV